MSEDGEKDQEKNEETSSRPVSASARRKQRSSGDAAAGNGGSAGAGKSPTPKGKASGGARDKAPQAKGQGKAKTEGKTEPTPKRDGKQRGQESLFRRVVRFLREVLGELKKVVWPTRKQMGTYTAVVLVFLAFMIALVFGLDYVWGQAVSFVFGG